MSSILVVLLTVIGQIAGTLGTSTAVTNVINMLVSILPTVIKEVEDLAPLIQNIIDALRGNSTITDAQKAALDDLEAKYDAAFEAAAALPDDPKMAP